MYLSKFNKTMPKSNEDFMGDIVLEVAGLDFFCIDNNSVTVNDHDFDSEGMTVLALSKIIEENGGTVSYIGPGYRFLPARIIANYSSYLIKTMNGSPIRLEEEMYRMQDMQYGFSPLGFNRAIIAGNILMSKEEKTTVIKKATHFRLFVNLIEYIGI